MVPALDELVRDVDIQVLDEREVARGEGEARGRAARAQQVRDVEDGEAVAAVEERGSFEAEAAAGGKEGRVEVVGRGGQAAGGDAEDHAVVGEEVGPDLLADFRWEFGEEGGSGLGVDGFGYEGLIEGIWLLEVF